jgi:hypothetical protein
VRGPDWLLDEWATRFAAGFEAMAGEDPGRKTAAPPTAFGNTVLGWRQPFDLAEGAAVEITVPVGGWRAVGKQILAAAGIDDAPDEDCKPTYFEVLQQSLSGLASALSAAVGREVGCGKGMEVAASSPAGGVEFRVGGQSFVCGFTASPAMLDALRPPPPAPTAAAAPHLPRSSSYTTLSCR